MPPTIISRKASNWVDRGEPAVPVLGRVLAFYFNRHELSDQPWLDEHANIILGMVAADATEIHVAGYLRAIEHEDPTPPSEPRHARATAIGLWHIAKSALVRDFAERVLQGEVPVNAPTPDSLSHWLAGRLLTAEELTRFEAEAGDSDEPDRDAPTRY